LGGEWGSLAEPQMTHAPGLIRNRLLAALPAAEFERIAPHLELVAMPLGKCLYQPGVLLSHAWFPTTAIVSLICVMEDGASSKFASVGNEGVIGTSLFMDADAPPGLAIVDVGGFGYRLKGRVLMEEFHRDGTMQRILLRYVQALLKQVCQTAACNHYHTVEQQLSHLLLQTVDRLHSSELILTQELIARLLGVRREGITEAAGHLQKAGCIRYYRGHITVLDRHGLESRSCECYSVVRHEFERLFARTRIRPRALPTRTAISLPAFQMAGSGKAEGMRSPGP